MQKIRKDFGNTPEALRKVFEDKKVDLLEKAEQHAFSGYDAAKDDLLALAHYKCVYCDRYLFTSAPEKKILLHSSVDHHRPKKGGYWWLAYEWSNLYILCTPCNRHKRGTFPIGNEKAKAPILRQADGSKAFDMSQFPADCPTLQNENPLYLHPEIDNIDDFYHIQADGSLKPKPDLCASQQQRAQTTLHILRPPAYANIKTARKQIVEEHRNSIEKALIALAENPTQENLQQLQQIIEALFCSAETPELEHSIVHRQLFWSQFDELITAFFQKQGFAGVEILQAVYKNHIERQL